MDMSILPHPLMDPKGDPREGTFEIPPPPEEVDDSFIKMCSSHSRTVSRHWCTFRTCLQVSEPQPHASIRAVQRASEDESW